MERFVALCCLDGEKSWVVFQVMLVRMPSKNQKIQGGHLGDHEVDDLIKMADEEGPNLDWGDTNSSRC